MRTTKVLVNSTLLAVAMIAIGLCLSTFVQAAAADEVSLSISPSDTLINNTEIKSVDITITNNQNFADTFSLSVWPSTTWAGITPNLERYSISNLESKSSETVKLYLSAAADAEPIATSFLVTATSTSVLTKNVSASAAVIVRTQRRTSVYISDLFIDKYALDPEDCMNIRIDVTNLNPATESYKLSTVITKDMNPVNRLEDDLLDVDGKSVGSATHSYCIGKYMENGEYTLSATLKSSLNKLIDTRSVNFRVSPKVMLTYDKSVSYTPFAQIKTITVKNEGNVVEKDFYITESVSDFVSKLFYPVTTPTSVESADGKVSYSWKIDRLPPGEETSVTYEIRFVSIWFSGIVIAIVVYIAFTYVYTPRISKQFTMIGPLKRGKEIAMLLELRNSTLYEIKNITVSDSIPPLASLVEKFDTMRPEAKKTDAGTELMWKIKSLKPFEERVLTYRIKTNVDIIGSMHLPKAGMEYLNQKRQTKIVSSKAIELK